VAGAPVSGAREEMLARVRGALEGAPADPPFERAYRRESGEPQELLIARFAERVGEYRAEVVRVPGAGVAEAAAAAFAEHAAARVVVPPDLPHDWRPEGIEIVEDHGLSPAELDAVDGVMTGCAVAIAETGTFVLDGGAAQGRRALTLVPDLHVCVVGADQIAALVPEALERVARRRSPVTLVSGPSATSDIELERVEGVHGPRRLHVLIAEWV
jgi:L-lactate dehydrogenase complex protein LldG